MLNESLVCLQIQLRPEQEERGEFSITPRKPNFKHHTACRWIYLIVELTLCLDLPTAEPHSVSLSMEIRFISTAIANSNFEHKDGVRELFCLSEIYSSGSVNRLGGL